MEETKTAVEMTAEEKAEFEAFKAKRLKEQQAQQRKENREAYSQLVDEQIELAIPELKQMSADLSTLKKKIFENFKDVIQMKKDIMHMAKDGGQFSHTFINSKGNMRISLGNNLIDSYKDTVEEGIAMINEYIADLAIDDKTKTLVTMVQKLLSKDSKGTLKASRVLQLEAMAEKIGDEKFIEGVKIIKESYQPVTTSLYIRAQVKDQETGAFVNVPLSIADAY